MLPQAAWPRGIARRLRESLAGRLEVLSLLPLAGHGDVRRGRSDQLDPGDGIRLMASNDAPPMLRLHGDRDSLLAALTAHWADQQLQIPSALRLVIAGLIQPALQALMAPHQPAPPCP